VEKMCSEAGVILLYLPPYLPGLNPIKKFSSELKMFVKKYHKAEAGDDFGHFLELFVRAVGACKESTKYYFRGAGVGIEDYKQIPLVACIL
jgi:transposase